MSGDFDRLAAHSNGASRDLHSCAKPHLYLSLHLILPGPGLLQYERSDLSAGRKVDLPMHLALLLLLWCKHSVLSTGEFASSPTDPRP